MKRTLLFFVLFLLSAGGFAQIHRGIFSEASVQKTSPRYDSRKQKGYYNTLQVSLLMGNIQVTDRSHYYVPYPDFYTSSVVPDPYFHDNGTKMVLSPSVTVSGGFRLNKHWATGAGVGFEVFDYFLFPLFAEWRYTLLRKKISPFITMKGGYALGHVRQKQVDQFYLKGSSYYVTNVVLRNYGGVMFSPEAGIKVPMDENIDLLITAAFRYQQKKSVARKDYESGQFEEWEHKEEINRLSLGIAILF